MRYLFLLFLLVALSAHGRRMTGLFDYSVELRGYTSPETNSPPRAYIRLPEGCDTVRAVLLCQQNMTEEVFLRSPLFQARMRGLGVAMVWVAPQLSQDWSPNSEAQRVFEQMMIDLAQETRHAELAEAKIIPLGHSAQATFPWNFAAWNPRRTLCIISFHGDAPRTNLTGYGRENIEWGRTRNIDGIPALMVEGEYEWWEARVRPALAFQVMYPGALISFFCDTGRGHFDCGERTLAYVALFIEKAMKARFAPRYLSRFRPDMVGTDGDDRGRQPQAFGPYAEPVRQPAADLFWYPDEEMAQLTLARYRETRGRLPLFLQPAAPPRLFGDTVRLTLPVLPADYGGRLHTETICGPVRRLDDTTLVTFPYEADPCAPRRSQTAWVAIVAPTDARYKGGVLPVEIHLKH